MSSIKKIYGITSLVIQITSICTNSQLPILGNGQVLRIVLDVFEECGDDYLSDIVRGENENEKESKVRIEGKRNR